MITTQQLSLTRQVYKDYSPFWANTEGPHSTWLGILQSQGNQQGACMAHMRGRQESAPGLLQVQGWSSEITEVASI